MKFIRPPILLHGPHSLSTTARRPGNVGSERAGRGSAQCGSLIAIRWIKISCGTRPSLLWRRSGATGRKSDRRPAGPAGRDPGGLGFGILQVATQARLLYRLISIASRLANARLSVEESFGSRCVSTSKVVRTPIIGIESGILRIRPVVLSPRN